MELELSVKLEPVFVMEELRQFFGFFEFFVYSVLCYVCFKCVFSTGSEGRCQR